MIERSRAIVLGAVEGPTELLPVSSSAHLTLIPWLAGWDLDGRDPELDNSFGVALHAGAAAALLIGQRKVARQHLHHQLNALCPGLSAPAGHGKALGLEQEAQGLEDVGQ